MTQTKPILLLSFLLLLSSFGVLAQEQDENGKWWDNNLTFVVTKDQLLEFGELSICVFDTSRDMCVQNLITPFEVLIYNKEGDQIWSSLWRGNNTDLKFSKELPNAHYIIIRAKRDFVINKRTGTRIHQKEPMEIKYTVRR
ncbi:MAG: hypothetical protein LPK80_04825 [Bacteroidota bacterium]|nr:hypothetical protein [Bacteroidota bacterium]